MLLSIIILNFNTKELTIACVDSLFAYYHKQIEKKEFEIRIIDNASTDASVKAIQQQVWFSQITCIQNKENVGFSKGCNRGAKDAKGSYLLFLNSDTTLRDTGLLKMVSFLGKEEKVGILGGKLQNSDGTFQASAGVFYTVPRVIALLFGAERIGKLRFSPKSIERVDWVSGAMMMMKKNLFEKLGGFDEAFFMYMEDMELCFRIKKQGKEVVFYPHCVALHISHGSSNRSFAIAQIYKGILYFYKKHANHIDYTLVKGLLIAKAQTLIGVGTILGKKDLRQTYSKALEAIV